MALFSRGRPKAPLWLRWILRLVILLAAFFVFAQDSWRPYFDNWRCGRKAAEISKQYGLVVKYGDPTKFFIPPAPPASNDPEIGFYIGPSNAHSALIALQGIQTALKKYPKNFILKHLKAIFIPGILKLYNVEVGGTLFQSWIYISATPDSDFFGSLMYEKILHHEFSSIVMDSAAFPVDKWCAINEPSFKYLAKTIDIVYATKGKSRNEKKSAQQWYKLGFVHSYGMSSIHNDFNMYAELAMAEPKKLIQLVKQYPKIREKTQILVDFYSNLAPELAAYFKESGLTESVIK